MKVVSVLSEPNADTTHVMVLNDSEFKAIKLALCRFAMTPMSEIQHEQDIRPEGPLWGLWRRAQQMDLDLRGYGL